MAFSHRVNRANVQERPAYKPIPEGEYDVQIFRAEDAVSQKTGKDMIKLEIEIAGGEFAGRKFFQYIVDDQFADQKIFDIFTSCRRAIPEVVTSAVFVGLTGRVKTKTTIYNGEPRAEIRYWCRPAKDPAPTAATLPEEEDAPF